MLAARPHPVPTDRPFLLSFCLLQYEGTAAATAMMGEASKQGSAERHNAVLWTVLVPVHSVANLFLLLCSAEQIPELPPVLLNALPR